MYIIIIFGFLIFAVRAGIMYIGQSKSKEFDIGNIDDTNLPNISVVVPARNEEKNIYRCVESLMSSNYPADKFEIIAVNDRSNDSTGSLLDKLAMKFKNLKPIHLTEDNKENNLKGKPGALQAGIDVANGDYILMTDADCAVNPDWMKTLAASFINHNLNLIPSFTLIDSKNLFDKIQETEWIYMHTMASAGVALKNPLGCFGNNLSIKKEVYDSLGGYKNIDFSVTEDLALLRAVHNNYGNVQYLCDAKATVTTLPEKTLKDYISQHRRWALGGLDLGWRASVFVASSIGIWIAIVMSFVLNMPITGISLIIFRILADSSLIFSSMQKLKLPSKLYFWIIPSVIFFMLMELIMPILIINKKITWKGQTFGK
jgi:cellulose synthase/poly-beta-1,6-N-acetylglucosamine synthase-like glycosyltransferase